MSTKKVAGWGAVLLLFLSVTLSAHVLHVNLGGEGLWDEQEAYFFVHRINRGSETPWILVPFLVALNSLGIIAPPVDDTSASLIVIHVAPSGVDRHDLEIDPTYPSRYTPREGRIWAHYPAMGGLTWWTGDHFERATEEEKKRMGDQSQLDFRSTSAKGWTKRMIDLGFIERLANGLELRVFSGPEALDIRIGRGSEATTIFFLEAHAGLTSRGEYRRIFSKHAKR